MCRSIRMSHAARRTASAGFAFPARGFKVLTLFVHEILYTCASVASYLTVCEDLSENSENLTRRAPSPAGTSLVWIRDKANSNTDTATTDGKAMEIGRQLSELEILQAFYSPEALVFDPVERQALEILRAADGHSRVEGCPDISGKLVFPELGGLSLRFRLPPGYPACAPPYVAVEHRDPRLVERLSAVASDAAKEAGEGNEAIIVIAEAVRAEAQEQLEAAARTGVASTTGPPLTLGRRLVW